MKPLPSLLAVAVCLSFITAVHAGEPIQSSKQKTAAPVIKSKTGVSETAKPSAKKTTVKSPAKQARIQSFLARLDKARTLDEVTRAFKQSRFTQAELNQLEKAQADPGESSCQIQN